MPTNRKGPILEAAEPQPPHVTAVATSKASGGKLHTVLLIDGKLQDTTFTPSAAIALIASLAKAMYHGYPE